MLISALPVRQHAIGVGLSRSRPFAVRARKAQPIVEPLRRIKVITRQDRDQSSGRAHSYTPTSCNNFRPLFSTSGNLSPLRWELELGQPTSNLRIYEYMP